MPTSALRVHVTGAKGMLAQNLVPELLRRGMLLSLSDRQSGEFHVEGRVLSVAGVDICDEQCLRRELSEPIDWLINCAAYTAVDKAESDVNSAMAVNGQGPGNLAKFLANSNACLVHISSDYVFGGVDGCSPRRIPYREDDTPDACGEYGRSKLLGDQLVQEHLPNRHLIVRTSWLHGIYGPNFIDTMLRVGKEREELRVVNDQIGSPTWTVWLAQVIGDLMEREQRGIFHSSSVGGISWFDFAKEIFRQAKMSTRVLPQTTEELARPAPRPRYSMFDTTKLSHVLGRKIISWQDCIAGHLAALETKDHVKTH